MDVTWTAAMANAEGSTHQLDTHPLAHDECVSQGVADGHTVVISHHCEQKAVLLAKVTNKNIWVVQPAKEIGWFWAVRLESIRGMVTGVYIVSELARMIRKKYMGMWRWRSMWIIVTMMTLPARVNVYRMRKTAKRMIWCSWNLENPRKMNSVTSVRFFLCILQFQCLKAMQGVNMEKFPSWPLKQG